MTTTPTYRVMDRVRTLVQIGAKLPKGSVGVVQSVNYDLYPKDDKGLAYVLSVVFPVLGNADQFYRDIEDLDPKSVPHMNAVAFRASEVEKVDSLAIEAKKDEPSA